jgi:hypothetical protein
MIYWKNCKEKKIIMMMFLHLNINHIYGISKKKKHLFLKKVKINYNCIGISKNLFYDEINCSNWNQLGSMPLV